MWMQAALPVLTMVDHVQRGLALMHSRQLCGRGWHGFSVLDMTVQLPNLPLSHTQVLPVEEV
jgi:hypothetical protein